MQVNEYIEGKRILIEKALKEYLPSRDEYPETIHEAIHYTVFNGGKRIRPILVIASHEACGGKAEDALPVACGIELIHTYSLIHDDLPALDNDDYRRGKSSCHKAFGEAVAILTGDALLSLAFGVAVRNTENVEGKRIIDVIKEMAFGSGSLGMVGGQVVDLALSDTKPTPKLIQYIHTHKTASLFRTAVRCGGILAGASSRELESLTIYGENVGFAFQIVDDILDLEDGKRERASYPALFGLESAREKVKELIERANLEIDLFGKEGLPLKMIGDLILKRGG
jgi:geranylgeranyl diphosphate synthase type II